MFNHVQVHWIQSLILLQTHSYSIHTLRRVSQPFGAFDALCSGKKTVSNCRLFYFVLKYRICFVYCKQSFYHCTTQNDRIITIWLNILCTCCIATCVNQSSCVLRKRNWQICNQSFTEESRWRLSHRKCERCFLNVLTIENTAMILTNQCRTKTRRFTLNFKDRSSDLMITVSRFIDCEKRSQVTWRWTLLIVSGIRSHSERNKAEAIHSWKCCIDAERSKRHHHCWTMSRTDHDRCCTCFCTITQTSFSNEYTRRHNTRRQVNSSERYYWRLKHNWSEVVLHNCELSENDKTKLWKMTVTDDSCLTFQFLMTRWSHIFWRMKVCVSFCSMMMTRCKNMIVCNQTEVKMIQ